MLKSNAYPVHSSYEAWRITYQSSEQAARAAYALANEMVEKAARYDRLLAHIEAHGAVLVKRFNDGSISVVWDVPHRFYNTSERAQEIAGEYLK